MDVQPDVLFRSLSDPGRRDILRLVGEAPLSVGEIGEVLALPQSTVSRHIKILRGTGLLIDRREGNRTFIGLRDPASNPESGLGDLLNAWLREQPLAESIRFRFEGVMVSRNGRHDAFERLAQQWDELRSRFFGGLFHLEALIALLPRDWTVLDIGTGTGYLLPVLSRQFRRVVAVDPSRAMLDLARERSRREGLENVSFDRGRLESLPLDDEEVDAALCVLALHHSADPERSLGELARVLKPGGRLLIVDLMPHQLRDFRRQMQDDSDGVEPNQILLLAREAGFKNLTERRLPAPPADHPAAARKPAPDLFVLTGEYSRH